MGMESASRAYQTIRVAPLQIKQEVCERIDKQIDLAQQNLPCGLFFKTNSITDKDIIEKLAEASQAGVPITLLVRGISCLVPGLEGYTDNIRVVSIVGRLLEHSRIYGFGPHDNMQLFLSSADLMTRNMDKRVEIAWPLLGQEIRAKAMHYIDTCLADTAKLRELKPDGSFTELLELATDEERESGTYFNAQETLIAEAKKASEIALEEELSEKSAFDKLSMRAHADRKTAARERAAVADLEEIFREALQHNMPAADDEALKPFIKAAAKTFAEVAVEESLIPEDALLIETDSSSEAEESPDTSDEAAPEIEVQTDDAVADADEALQAAEAEEDGAKAQADAEDVASEAEPEAESAPEAQPEPATEPASTPVEPAEPTAPEPTSSDATPQDEPPAPEPVKLDSETVAKAPASPEAKHAAPKPKKRFFLWRLFSRKK